MAATRISPPEATHNQPQHPHCLQPFACVILSSITNKHCTRYMPLINKFLRGKLPYGCPWSGSQLELTRHATGNRRLSYTTASKLLGYWSHLASQSYFTTDKESVPSDSKSYIQYVLCTSVCMSLAKSFTVMSTHPNCQATTATPTTTSSTMTTTATREPMITGTLLCSIVIPLASEGGR